MGIKGIYGEIGVGERIALSKLATEKFVETGRPLRIAIDISIWQFQVQSGRGGSNPALRTFYYRLLRLLSLSIQPLFVFDGVHKPPFKRGRRTCATTASLPNFLSKQLLQLFGFPFVVAPGEAEAECALLQREGIVDAVLSEDVDTLMFGCGRSMRNWSSEGVRGSSTPTHVSVYDASKIVAGASGLDREGMVLVALMSGGDYIPAGIPGCGIKVACEAARAGFGKSLFNLSTTDTVGFKAWRDSLAHELRSNESKFFRVKHKALRLPETFPNQEVLGYYTHPVVSSAEGIKRLKNKLRWDGEVDIAGLRTFVADAFEWRHKSGAEWFIRGLAPALLCWKLRTRGAAAPTDERPASSKAEEESVVKSLCGKRAHRSADEIPEIRVKYIPIDIVGLDLDTEEQDDGSIEVSDVEAFPPLEPDLVEGPGVLVTLPTNKSRLPYSPTEPQRAWVGEPYVRVGVPLTFQDWEESLRIKESKIASAKPAGRGRRKRPPLSGGMKAGALEPFVKATKPGLGLDRAKKTANATRPPPPELFEPASDTRSQLLEELEVHNANSEPATGNKRRVTRKENAVKTVSPVATRSQRANLGTLPNGKSRVLAKDERRDSGVPLPRGHRHLVSGTHGPMGDVGDPRPEQSLTRDEPKGSKSLAPLERTPEAFKTHGSLPPPASLPHKASVEKECVPMAPEIPRKHLLSCVENTIEERLPSNTTDRPCAGKERTPARRGSRHSAKEHITLPDPPLLGPDCGDQHVKSATARFEEDGLEATLARTEANRRLDCSPPTRLPPTQAQMVLSSPSPSSTSTPQPRHSPRKIEACSPSSSPPRSVTRKETFPASVCSKPQTDTKLIRMVAPRESLPGAWKEVDGLEAKIRSSVFVEVEVLDMTGGI